VRRVGDDGSATVKQQVESDFLEALESYQEAGGRETREGRAALLKFVAAHPDSAYRLSAELEIGSALWISGAWQAALDHWQAAWVAARAADGSDLETKRAGDLALRELLLHLGLLGQKDHLRQLLAEIKERPYGGDLGSAIHRATELLWFLDNRAEQNVFCGFSAANLVCVPLGREAIFPDVHDAAEAAQFIERGVSLWDIAEHSHEAGGDLACIARTNAAAPFPVPAVIHWKFGHFSAILERREDGALLVKDDQLKFNSWVAPETLAGESSGYALVPAAAGVPEGFRTVPEDEARKILGRHCVHGYDDEGCDPETGSCPGGRGMPTYSLNLRRGYHSLVDTPLGYDAPFGGGLDITLKYAAFSPVPTVVSDSCSFGPLWFPTFGAGAKIVLTGNGTPASSVEWQTGTGAYNLYNLAGSVYSTRNAEMPTLSYLANTGVGGPGYRLSFADGSIEEFTHSVGTPVTSYLLTRSIDAQGNTWLYEYSTQHLLVAITDPHQMTLPIADRLCTEIHYEIPLAEASEYDVVHAEDQATVGNFPNLVRYITDPWGRIARFIYDNHGRLKKIIDPVGLQSSFEYGGFHEDFITSMTTPYGTTRFEGQIGNITVTDPTGLQERVIQTDGAPTLVLNATEAPPVAG